MCGVPDTGTVNMIEWAAAKISQLHGNTMKHGANTIKFRRREPNIAATSAEESLKKSRESSSSGR
jgi:hypothetical protein